jgi:hypothetical protein
LGIHSCSLGVPILVEELSAASAQNAAGKKQS